MTQIVGFSPLLRAVLIAKDRKKLCPQCNRRHGGKCTRLDEAARLEMLLKAEAAIYFLMSHSHQIVKIGVSTDVVARIQAIKQGSPIPLELVACLRGPAQLERALHVYLRESRLKGEWFRVTDAVKRIVELAQGDSLQARVNAWMVSVADRIGQTRDPWERAVFFKRHFPSMESLLATSVGVL